MMDAAVISDAKAREVLLGELAPLDEAAVTPDLGEHAFPGQVP